MLVYHDPAHPAVIRLLRHVLKAAARASKPVTACGDLAGDIALMAVLLALGIRRLSVSQVDFPALASVIPQLSIAPLSSHASEVRKRQIEPDRPGYGVEAVRRR